MIKVEMFSRFYGIYKYRLPLGWTYHIIVVQFQETFCYKSIYYYYSDNLIVNSKILWYCTYSKVWSRIIRIKYLISCFSRVAPEEIKKRVKDAIAKKDRAQNAKRIRAKGDASSTIRSRRENKYEIKDSANAFRDDWNKKKCMYIHIFLPNKIKSI